MSNALNVKAEQSSITRVLHVLGATATEIHYLLLNFPYGTGAQVRGFTRVEDFGDTPMYTIENVPLDYLDSEQAYQRKDKKQFQKKLARAKKFKSNLSHLVCASRVMDVKQTRLGAWQLLDGKQRKGILRGKGKNSATVDLLLTDCEKSEAQLFDELNNRTNMTSADKLPSQLLLEKQGDEHYEVREICGRHGLALTGDPRPPKGTTREMASITELVKCWRADASAFEGAIKALMYLPAWKTDAETPRYELVKALTKLIQHDPYNDVKLWNRLKTGTYMVGQRYTARQLYGEMLQYRSRSMKGGKDTPDQLAAGLAKYLNRHCTKNKLTYPAV